jgi:hypothetical protein
MSQPVVPGQDGTLLTEIKTARQLCGKLSAALHLVGSSN